MGQSNFPFCTLFLILINMNKICSEDKIFFIIEVYVSFVSSPAYQPQTNYSCVVDISLLALGNNPSKKFVNFYQIIQ